MICFTSWLLDGILTNAWCPRLTAAMILSGSAVHVKGFGSALVSAETVDGGLEVDDGAEDAAFQSGGWTAWRRSPRPH